MMVPVRCFSCGKVVGHLYDKYHKAIAEQNITDAEGRSRVFTELGLNRYCCRRTILGTVDLIDEIKNFR